LARLQADAQTWPQDVEQLTFPAHGGGVDLVVMMMQLAKRQVNSIWVEAGAQLAGALLQAGLVDELILYIAPKLLGDNGRGLCQLPALSVWPMRRSLFSAKYGKLAPICGCG
jgi:diaminohydroxyphosphoribosylaminopyrimidine deaminase/5-amino-6-(5-phosphoribosylamino)uracil reductase